MAPVKRKALADDIADLLNPLPDTARDPDEANVLDGGAVVMDSDDDLAATAGMGRARILPDIVLEDKAYAGKRTSRKATFEEDSDDDYAEGLDRPSNRDVEPLSSDSEHDEGYSYGGIQADAEIAALEQAVEEMQADEGDAAGHLAERAKAERKKALAVQAQHRLWEASLELRILLQRLLKAAVRMPQGVILAGAADESEADKQALQDMKTDAYKLADSFVDVLAGLQAVNPSIAASLPERKRARTCDGLWQEMDGWYNAIKPFQDASIDRWHRKTLVSGGNLKALNKSVSEQVAQLLQNVEPTIERTQILVDQVAVLGRVPQTKDGITGADVNAKTRDAETFDDTEFYSTLLKELLENTDSTALASQKYAGEKRRKIVDRRASKGRRIRYDVQEKLVNFMTPQETGSPTLASRLFGRLFGSMA